MTFAPRLTPKVFELIEALDDGQKPKAQLWREIGAELRRQDELQPSYESVRRLVTVMRRLRAVLQAGVTRTTVLAAQILWGRSRRETVTTRASASADRSPSGTASPRGGP